MEEEDFDRTLRIEIPGCSFAKPGSPDPAWTDLTFSNGWRPIAGGLSIGWTGTIDLSGYARQRKTFYPHGGFSQQASSYNAFDGSGQSVVTVVSSVPITPEELSFMFLNLSSPGMIGVNAVEVSQLNFEQVMFCEYQLNLINTTLPALGTCQPIERTQTGSFEATAADKLYVVKIVIPATVASATGTTLSVPASRVVLPGRMGSEPDLEYMMRLSRSVQLANQV